MRWPSGSRSGTAGAGLTTTTSSLNTALKAMRDAAAKDLMAAEAAARKGPAAYADAA